MLMQHFPKNTWVGIILKFWPSRHSQGGKFSTSDTSFLKETNFHHLNIHFKGNLW